MSHTTDHGVTPASGFALIPALLGLVRFSHTVFALPFALAGALLAELAFPSARVLIWVIVAMVGARSLAMAINRLVDARIDARNPRTAGRELPSGRLTSRQVIAFSAISLAALLLAVSQLPPITWYLWPIPVAAFVLYPFTKRFTWACHVVLGVTIGLAPVGGWIAVTGSFAWAPVFLGLGVACWIAGFDVLYALLDIDFDRREDVRSIPVRFGIGRSVMITRALHLAALAFLALGGITADAGWIYLAGVGVCAAILLYENLIVHPNDPVRINRAFGAANMVMAVTYIAFVVLEVAL